MKYTKSFTRRNNYTDNTQYNGTGKPSKEGKLDDLLSIKALKNLPASSYSVQADPYTASLPTSRPYPLLTTFNKTVGGSYAGLPNLDGGNVQQYANSINSGFLKIADSMRLQKNINYRYLPILPQSGSHYRGKALVNENLKAIAESMSILQSTTYTQMALNRYAVKTNLPMGDAKTVHFAGETQYDLYTDKSAVFYAMSVYYQTFWLNILNTLTWHNSFRVKQGTAIRDAWNREVPVLNAFFGLMNKKSFLAVIDSINLSFEGEYIDTGFARQAAMLNAMPSRRSNAMTDPVLEVQTAYNMPDIEVYYLNADGSAVLAKVFDSKDLKYAPADKEFTFTQAIENLNDYLSLEATKVWARNTTVGDASDTVRFNQINQWFQVINYCVNMFKPAWNDYREALDTTSRAGIVQWQKGFRPATTKDTDAPLFRNMIVDDIYQLIMSGASSLEFDQSTKRLRSYSLWNMYTGIPEYDAKQGGVFLALSCKDVTGISDDPDGTPDYLPVIFEYNSAENEIVEAVTRDGKVFIITKGVKILGNDKILNRLAPLPTQASLSLRVPTVDSAHNKDLYGNSAIDTYLSFISKTLLTVFGLCTIQNSGGTTYNTEVDSDILAIYQVEFEDITNEAVTYARANSPFRGTTSSAGILGFFGALRAE